MFVRDYDVGSLHDFIFYYQAISQVGFNVRY